MSITDRSTRLRARVVWRMLRRRFPQRRLLWFTRRKVFAELRTGASMETVYGQFAAKASQPDIITLVLGRLRALRRRLPKAP